MKAVIPAETFGKWIRDLLINSRDLKNYVLNKKISHIRHR
jgi:hypothetical protein